MALALAGNRCLNPFCRRRARLDLHHVIKRSAGRKDELWNLIPLCRECHNAVDLPAGSVGALRAIHLPADRIGFGVRTAAGQPIPETIKTDLVVWSPRPESVAVPKKEAPFA